MQLQLERDWYAWVDAGLPGHVTVASGQCQWPVSLHVSISKYIIIGCVPGARLWPCWYQLRAVGRGGAGRGATLVRTHGSRRHLRQLSEGGRFIQWKPARVAARSSCSAGAVGATSALHVASYSRAYTQCGGGRSRPPAAQNTQTATGPAQGAAQVSAAAAPQSTASTAKWRAASAHALRCAATGTGAALTLHTHYRSRKRGRGARGLREGYLVAEGGVLRHHGHGCPRKSAVLLSAIATQFARVSARDSCFSRIYRISWYSTGRYFSRSIFPQGFSSGEARTSTTNSRGYTRSPCKEEGHRSPRQGHPTKHPQR